MILGVFYMISVLQRAGVLLKSARDGNGIRVQGRGVIRRKIEKSSEKRLTKRRNVL